MNEIVWIPWVISGISMLAAVYFGLGNSKRNQNKDTSETASEMAKVMVKLEYISGGILEIKEDMANMRQNVQSDIDGIRKDERDSLERIAKVEALAASAHKRMDIFENNNRGRSE